MRQVRMELLSNRFERFEICKRCEAWSAGEPDVVVETLDNGQKVKKYIFNGELIYEKE